MKGGDRNSPPLFIYIWLLIRQKFFLKECLSEKWETIVFFQNVLDITIKGCGKKIDEKQFQVLLQLYIEC